MNLTGRQVLQKVVRVKNLPLRKFIEQQPCCACGKTPHERRIAAHHKKSWGSGGKDEYNLLPLCWYECHNFGVHTMPDSKFEEENGIDLDELCIYYTELFYKVNGDS